MKPVTHPTEASPYPHPQPWPHPHPHGITQVRMKPHPRPLPLTRLPMVEETIAKSETNANVVAGLEGSVSGEYIGVGIKGYDSDSLKEVLT